MKETTAWWFASATNAVCSPVQAQNRCAAALCEPALALVAFERRNVRRKCLHLDPSLSCLWAAWPNKGRGIRGHFARAGVHGACARDETPRERVGRRFLPPPVCASFAAAAHNRNVVPLGRRSVHRAWQPEGGCSPRRTPQNAPRSHKALPPAGACEPKLCARRARCVGGNPPRSLPGKIWEKRPLL
jgi:hypothetical protein